MILNSPAKINLFLEITGKKNNLHILHSCFVKITLHDTISVNPSNALHISYGGTNIQNDIIYKTITTLKKYFPSINTNFKFEVEKKIPIGAGLGGASSNAASVMQFLFNVNNIQITMGKMLHIALEIGSDVPFFLHNTPMILNGIGTELHMPQFQIPQLYFALLYPNYKLITKDVFACVVPPFSTVKGVESFSECCTRSNELQTIACKLSNGLIANTLQEISHPKALCVKMSGSGSVCFALFTKKEDMQYKNSNIIYAQSIA